MGTSAEAVGGEEGEGGGVRLIHFTREVFPDVVFVRSLRGLPHNTSLQSFPVLLFREFL